MSADAVSTPIDDFVRKYAERDFSRFHMPGHKGRGGHGEERDLTEIEGADELYAPHGIIAESEANATALFGTSHTYYSTEGSSQCIRAMLFLALQAAPQGAERPVLLAARNAHKALLYAAALLDFDIVWLWPDAQAASTLCSCPISPAELTEALKILTAQGRRPFGVYVTSPDYLGGMQDISALAAVCRTFGTPLLVDNAHGAYLHFLPGKSLHPIALGAAMCCDSAHKTLPAFTGGAYLHIGKTAPDSMKNETAARGALALFGSTSPSYLILSSLDRCNCWLAGEFPSMLAECVRQTADLAAEVNASAAQVGCPVPLVHTGAQREPLKLTLDAAALDSSGAELAQKLRAHKIECEYADPRYVVLMPSPGNLPRDFERLRSALLDAVHSAPAHIPQPESEAGEFAALAAQAAQRCTIRQAMLAPQERVPATEALGRICAMPTVSCPPAIPIAVSGEEIGPAASALFERYGIDEVSVVK